MNYSDLKESALYILFKKIPINAKLTFFSALILGVVTHMYMLTNKFPNPDDTSHMFDLGVTIPGGRFGLAFLEHKWFGLDVSFFAAYSMPWLNGLVAISFIALSAALIVCIFQIYRPVLCILVGFIMVVYPTVTGTLHYMFTAHAYFFALLCSVLSVYMICKIKNKIIAVLFCELLLVIVLSIYQAYFWFAIGLFILVLLFGCIDGSYDAKPLNAMLRGGGYVGLLIAALIIYFLVNKIVLNVANMSMTSYAGLDDMSSVLLNPDFFEYIKLSYKKFFENAYNPLEEGASFRFILFVLLGIVWFIQAADILIRKNNTSTFIKVLSVCILFIFPFGAGSIYFVSTHFVHSLMIYPTVLIYIAFIIFCDRHAGITERKTVFFKSHLSKITAICILFICVNYAVMANAIYLGSQITTSQALSFLNRLAMRIEMVDDFDIKTMPVAFIGSPNDLQYPHTLSELYTLNNVTGVCFENNPAKDYEQNVLLHTGASKVNLRQMERYLGIKLEHATKEQVNAIQETTEYKEMSMYPSSDSLKIINNVLVVKFIDN